MDTYLLSTELKRRLRIMAYLAFALALLFSGAACLSTYPQVQAILAPLHLGAPNMTADERLGVYAMSGLFATFGALSWLGGKP